MSEAIKKPVGPEGIIQMQGVNKWYGQFHVLKDINLNVKQGERIVLCGPSGSGKSTTIRCLTRLEEHQQGRIVVDGVVPTVASVSVPVGVQYNAGDTLTFVVSVSETVIVNGTPRLAKLERGIGIARHKYLLNRHFLRAILLDNLGQGIKNHF